MPQAATTTQEKSKYFISYARRDEEAARELRRALDERKIPYWFDNQDIPFGELFRPEIVTAIKESRGVILLLSDSSNSSDYVRREISRAWDEGKKIFVVRLTGVKLSDSLADLNDVQHADFWNLEQRERLLQQLESEPEPRDEAPRTPERPSRILRNRARLFVRKNALVFSLLAFVFACVSMSLLERGIEGNVLPVVLAQKVFTIASLYNNWVGGDTRSADSHVAVIVLDEHTPAGVIRWELCKQRLYLGNLLKSVALLKPRVVVIDKYFGPDRCDPGDPGTTNLVAGVRKLCEANIPVVIGRAAEPEPQKTEMAQYPLKPGIDFKSAGASCVVEALIDLNPDLRRVSLCFKDVQPVNRSQEQPPSLAFATALAYDPNLDLSRWEPPAEPPFVASVKPGAFDDRTKNAGDVLCGTLEDWKPCESPEGRPGTKGFAERKVVIIAERSSRDEQDMLVDTVQGYELQANLIDSLLDGHLFEPASAPLVWLVGLVVFASFEYFAAKWTLWRAGAVLGALVATAALAYITLVKGHYYFNPIPVGILAFVYSRTTAFFLNKL